MEHVVFFPSSDGAPAFRRLPSFEDAVRLVEHLRNVEGVEHVSVHVLTEVPLAFRAYYRVEVPATWEAPADQVVPVVGAPAVEPVATAAPAPAEQVQPVPVEPEGVPALALVEALPVQAGEPEPTVAASNGHGGSSSLGFFA